MFADRALVGTSDTQVSQSVQLSTHCRPYSKQALAGTRSMDIDSDMLRLLIHVWKHTQTYMETSCMLDGTIRILCRFASTLVHMYEHDHIERQSEMPEPVPPPGNGKKKKRKSNRLHEYILGNNDRVIGKQASCLQIMNNQNLSMNKTNGER